MTPKPSRISYNDCQTEYLNGFYKIYRDDDYFDRDNDDISTKGQWPKTKPTYYETKNYLFVTNW